MTYRCPLAKLIPETIDAEKVKRDGWNEQSILVVSADDHRLDFFQREFVKQIGEKLYGAKRKF